MFLRRDHRFRFSWNLPYEYDSDEPEVEVEVVAEPYEPPTWSDPGYPGGIRIESVRDSEGEIELPEWVEKQLEEVAGDELEAQVPTVG